MAISQHSALATVVSKYKSADHVGRAMRPRVSTMELVAEGSRMNAIACLNGGSHLREIKGAVAVGSCS